MRADLDAVRLALGTLTAVPVPPPGRIDPPVPGRAMVLAPAAGLIPGGAAFVAAWLAGRLGLGTGVAAVLCVAAYALITRGLHLDGLADTADGLAAAVPGRPGDPRERGLAVMRRGDVGPVGVATLTLTLLLQVAALAEALARIGPVAALAGAVIARVAVPLACRRGVAAARADGLGAHVAGSVTPVALAVTALATAVAVTAALVVADAAWWRGPLATLLAMGAATAVVGTASRRLGGITGDVIGAAVEAAAVAALLALAAT
jgi:adenosylcobinamide-GDP ribazoletransferase